jgi:cellulose synthase/poly-beta-1,6-N-acetylglucosamine synthase-like glycosyltransferase
MAGIIRGFMRSAEPAPQTGVHRPSVRATPRAHELTDLTARLPPELAFLATEGFSPERLLSAVGAGPKAVRPVDKLLSEGHISEEVYYRALARHLGCQYYDGDPPLAGAFDAIRGLRCGVAPLESHGAGPRAVIAPRAQFVPRLIEAAQTSRYRSGSFALASPQRFASLLRARRSEELLEVALGRLPARLTARHGMTRLQIAALGVLAALASALGVANFAALQAVASAALWLTFSAMILLRSMAAIANNRQSRPPALADDQLPDYTIVVALYRETRVVEDLIRALDGLEYPKSKLDIKLVVEERDAETLSRLIDLNLPARYEIIVAPPGPPQTKPRALNIALSSARGQLIVVYDAEDAPAADQLRLAAARFAADRNLDCLQARLAIRNRDESWLSHLFAIEYATLFDFINPGLCALDLPIALGGSSNHFRIRSLTDVGAWDEWNVTEDADLGIRLARFGYRVRALDSDTSEEAPHELKNWFRQRVRWQKGWMQTLIVHSRRPNLFRRDLGTQRAVAATTLIGGAIVGGLFWPAFALTTIWRALTVGHGELMPSRELTDVFTYILALSGIWAIVLPAAVAARLRGLKLNPRTLALMPVYYLLLTAATWTAMVHFVMWPHYWGKTDHGRTRLRPTLRVVQKRLSM